MKINRIFSIVVIFSLTVIISSSMLNIGQNNLVVATSEDPSIRNTFKPKAYEAPTLPAETHPDWKINITGIGFTEPITLNLTYLLDEVIAENLNAYQEVVDYKGNNQTIIGFDILDLIQDYADVWYAGELTFTAEDDYSKSLNVSEILYSYYPPALENADIKILLAVAVNGSYLPNSDWADKGALRLVVPSNSRITYFNNMWVGNVTEISISERWACDFYVDEVFETSVIVDEPATFTDYDYLTYNLTYHSESTKFEGPSILSIFEYINVDYDNIALFKAEAPDFIATIDKTELIGEKPAILTMKINNEYLGFNSGPYRLVGGVLNSWNWLKNCMAIHISTNSTSQSPTNTSPGYTFVVTALSLTSIPMLAITVRKRK